MFYSHTFLARKGPLGTVWCAAHLQSRLKKTHYISTDIPSTVDRIIYPEVPIALRLSGHLLLGVVRIYSKKVDYLRHDCDVVMSGLSKAFLASEVNLPEDATHATFESVTLPERFELDSWNVDDLYTQMNRDAHLRSLQEITLLDQIPVERELYVTISFDEDVNIKDTSHDRDEPRDEGFTPMEVHVDTDETEVLNQSNQPNLVKGTYRTESNDEMPPQDDSPECMREAFHDSNFEDPTVFTTVRPVDLSNILNASLSPEEHILVSPKQPDLPIFTSVAVPTISAHSTPNIQVLVSPPVEIQNARMGKIVYDIHPVLNNRAMRNAINDASNLLRIRKRLPSNALDQWRVVNKKLRNEQIFVQPSRTGMCMDIQNLFEAGFISSKMNLASVVKDVQSSKFPVRLSTVVESLDALPKVPQSPDTVPEYEQLRDILTNGNDDFNEFGDIMHFSPKIHSPLSQDQNTPVSLGSIRMEREIQMGPIVGTSALSPVSLDKFTGPFEYELQTPMFRLQEQIGGDFSDILQTFDSALQEDVDLHFLEVDNHTMMMGTPGIDTLSSSKEIDVNKLSVRTRAAVQYLKAQSPIFGTLEKSPGNLSLNNILAGKTRKLCARMFYEILVLKSHDLVGVQQEGPYCDIMLKVQL